MKFFDDSDQLRRLLALTIGLFCGINFYIYEFASNLLLASFFLITILNFKKILLSSIKFYFKALLLIILSYFVFFLKGAEYPIFIVLVISISVVTLSNYTKNISLLRYDLLKLLSCCMYLTIFSFFVMVVASSLFNEVLLDYALYKTFFYIFWYNPIGGIPILDGLRFTGITWEPGIWQMFLNLNLLLALYFQRSKFYLGLSIFSIIIVYSTAGIAIMGITIFLYIFYIIQKRKISRLIVPIIILFISYPLIIQNIQQKSSGDLAGSGMTRLADVFTGIIVLSDNPLFGADTDLATATNNSAIWATKAGFWNANRDDGKFDNYMKVKNSNGLVIFLLDWGLPLGLFLLFKMRKINIFENSRLNIVFIIIIFFSLFGEAISRTSFFYFFLLISLFNNDFKKINNV